MVTVLVTHITGDSNYRQQPLPVTQLLLTPITGDTLWVKAINGDTLLVTLLATHITGDSHYGRQPLPVAPITGNSHYW